MENKIKITYIDSTGFNNTSCSPSRTWDELFSSVTSIYSNFIQSKIFPEELKEFIEEKDISEHKGIPDIASIENLLRVMDRYIVEYKIPNSTFLFVDFKRHCAIYFFSIGDTFKSLQLLKEILSLLNDNIEQSKLNIDINLLCLKDCVKLNQACIMFWTEDYEESRLLLEEVLTYYEATDEEMYLIKMVNFISIAFTYLSWIYVRKEQYEDAEKAFLHSIKVLSTVKSYTNYELGETEFIDTKIRKIYLFDQLINFYAMLQRYDMVEKPINEILKIMDKSDFSYNYEISHINKIYYFFAAIIVESKKPDYINLTRILSYLCNVIKIIHDNSEALEQVPFRFYLIIFKIIEGYNYNNDKAIYNRNDNNDSRIDDIIEFICMYLDQVLSKYDLEKVFNLNPLSQNSYNDDSSLTIDKFSIYLKNKEFSEFNAIEKVKYFNSEEMLKKTELKDILPGRKGKFSNITTVPESFCIKTACDRVQYKFANIITDLVDSKSIEEKATLESLNGFLSFDNYEMTLYTTYRFVARNNMSDKKEDVKIGSLLLNNQINNDENRNIKLSKLILCYKRETSFAPLYFVRHSFKINKDNKSLNFSLYLGLLNLLYNKKLYLPCLNLLSLFIDEFSTEIDNLYSQINNNLVFEGLIYLFEFFLFMQVHILIMHENYDKALYSLLMLKTCTNEYNTMLKDLLMGICLSHYGFCELSLYYFTYSSQMIKVLLNTDGAKQYEKNRNRIKGNPTEMNSSSLNNKISNDLQHEVLECKY